MALSWSSLGNTIQSALDNLTDRGAANVATQQANAAQIAANAAATADLLKLEQQKQQQRTTVILAVLGATVVIAVMGVAIVLLLKK